MPDTSTIPEGFSSPLLCEWIARESARRNRVVEYSATHFQPFDPRTFLVTENVEIAP